MSDDVEMLVCIRTENVTRLLTDSIPSGCCRHFHIKIGLLSEPVSGYLFTNSEISIYIQYFLYKSTWSTWGDLGLVTYRNTNSDWITPWLIKIGKQVEQYDSLHNRSVCYSSHLVRWPCNWTEYPSVRTSVRLFFISYFIYTYFFLSVWKLAIGKYSLRYANLLKKSNLCPGERHMVTNLKSPNLISSHIFDEIDWRFRYYDSIQSFNELVWTGFTWFWVKVKVKRVNPYFIYNCIRDDRRSNSALLLFNFCWLDAEMESKVKFWKCHKALHYWINWVQAAKLRFGGGLLSQADSLKSGAEV